MKKYNKLISLILIIILLIFVFSGCDNKTSNIEKDKNNNTVEKSDDYPSKPVKIIVAYSPGGGSDRGVRLLQPYLEEALGQPVVVENQPGGGTEVATTVLNRSEADGYTIMASSQPDLNWTLLFQKPQYKKEDIDIAVVDVIDPRVILVTKDSKWNTFKEFADDCIANPGKYSASVIPNTGQFVLATYLKETLKIDFKMVPYEGGSPAAAAMLGGHVDITFGDAYSRSDIRDQAKCIGIAYNEPNAIWPEGQPLEEQLKEYNIKIPIINRAGIFAVRTEFKESYPDRYKKLVDAFMEAKENPEYKKLMEEQQLDTIQVWKTGEELEPEFNKMYDFLDKEIRPLLSLD